MNSNSSPQQFRGWLLAVAIGMLAGALIGSGSSGPFHWDRLGGPITAGSVVALVTTLFSAHRSLAKTTLGCVTVAVSSLMTIILRHWSTGHWAMWHVDGKSLLILVALFVYAYIPAILMVALVSGIRKLRAKKDID